MGDNQTTVLLDACCLINLYAMGSCREILAALQDEFAAAGQAIGEATHLLYETKDGSRAPKPIDWPPLIDEGLLTVLDIEGNDEDEKFVDFAPRLEEGEAATLAIATQRGFKVATDDRKAVKILEELGMEDIVTGTLAILKEWAEAANVARDQLAEALQNVRERGRYVPFRHHPLRRWWERSISADDRL